MILNKISDPSVIKIRKPHLFEPNMIQLPIMLKILAYDCLDQFSKECVNDEVDEIDIIFLSNLNDITFFHYMNQPKSMFCRKLIRNSIKEDFGNLIIIGFQINLEILTHNFYFKEKEFYKSFFFTSEYVYDNIKLNGRRFIVDKTLLEYEQKHGANYHRSAKVTCVADFLDKIKNETKNVTIER